MSKLPENTSVPTIEPTVRRASVPWYSDRRTLTFAAVVIVAGGFALNWSWLVAAGVAPILLTLLPCVLMCGLGLCVNKLLGKSCSKSDEQ